MIWPPIRYAYRIGQQRSADAGAVAPAFLHERARRPAPTIRRGADDPNCIAGNLNWLGTDDQGRDVLARLIYGFRISVLFGLILTVISSVIGVAAGAVQGYFGGWIDLLFQRFIEIWTSMPALYLLIILAAFIAPSFWCCWHPAAVHLDDAGRRGARRIPAGRNFEYVRAARALGLSNRRSCSSTCCRTHGGDADLPAVHPDGLGHDADLARLPGLRPAARLAVARRTAGAGQEQSAGALARPHRLLRRLAHADAADFHRRGGARRFDPRKTFP